MYTDVFNSLTGGSGKTVGRRTNSLGQVLYPFAFITKLNQRV